MLNDNIEFFLRAEKVISAYIGKCSFDECKKQIDNLMDPEIDNFRKKDSINLIYLLSKIFGDISVYSQTLRCFEEIGVAISEIRNDRKYYWIMKYFTGDEKTKKIAIKHLIGCLSTLYFCGTRSDLLILLLIMTGDEQLIKVLVKKDLLTSEFIYCFLKEKNTALLSALLEAGGQPDIDLTLKTAIEDPELYYGYFAENFYSYIPSVFKNKDSLRTVENLIPFLFRSKKYSEYLYKNILSNGIWGDVDNAYIIWHLYHLVDKKAYESIVDFLPSVHVISSGTAKLMISNCEQELMDIIVSKVDKSLHLLKSNTYYNNDFSLKQFKKLRKIFLGKEIHISTDLLFDYNNAEKIVKIIDVFNGRILTFSDEEKKYYKNVIMFDNKKLTEKAIECNLIDYSCYDKAIEFAVEEKKYNALEILNKKYSEVSEKYNHVADVPRLLGGGFHSDFQ